VIKPAETRPKLITALEMLVDKRESRPPRKHENISYRSGCSNTETDLERVGLLRWYGFTSLVAELFSLSAETTWRKSLSGPVT